MRTKGKPVATSKKPVVHCEHRTARKSCPVYQYDSEDCSSDDACTGTDGSDCSQEQSVGSPVSRSGPSSREMCIASDFTSVGEYSCSSDEAYDEEGWKCEDEEPAMELWRLQTAEALARTPQGVTELDQDQWTYVAESQVAGRGLFATTLLPANFVLYAYLGRMYNTDEEQADLRPNAYQFSLRNGMVCDAGPLHASSPARWVNTQPFDKQELCNCKYVEYRGKAWLVSLRTIQPKEELFVSYGKGKAPYALWPEGFLGDAYQQIDEYRAYLVNKPCNASADQKKYAKKLLWFLKRDLKYRGC